jgi:hypothetical protein
MPACPTKTSAKGWALIRVVARSMAERAGLLLGLAHLVVTTVHAAPPFSMLMLSEYQKQNWQVEDGLPENNIRMIAQRPDRALLLATASGLITFDGHPPGRYLAI